MLIDSELDQNLQSIVVETDNVAAGRKMGEFILTHLPENPVIGVVSHVKSSSTALERYQGLCEGLGDEKEHIVGTVYCDSNYEKAYNRTKTLLEEHPDINILVGLNEYSAIGAGKAIRDPGTFRFDPYGWFLTVLLKKSRCWKKGCSMPYSSEAL